MPEETAEINTPAGDNESFCLETDVLLKKKKKIEYKIYHERLAEIRRIFLYCLQHVYTLSQRVTVKYIFFIFAKYLLHR